MTTVDETITAELDPMVRTLAKLRADSAELKQQLQDIEAQIEATELGQIRKEVVENLAAVKGDEVDAAMKLRAAAVEVWSEGLCDKSPHPAVKIRKTKTPVYDPKRAKVWAMNNMPNLVKLDTRQFEIVAKRVEIPGVLIRLVAKASIGRDLSEYL